MSGVKWRGVEYFCAEYAVFGNDVEKRTSEAF